MKFSRGTIDILKNFTNINRSILFKPGKIISTIDDGETIMAMANIEEEITHEFAIFELNKFIGALSVMPNSNIEVNEERQCLVIKEGKSKMTYTFTEPSMIKASPYKEFPIGNILASFTLEYSTLSSIVKSANILELPDITILTEEGDIIIRAGSLNGVTNDNYQVRIGETSNNFSLSFKIENLKFLNRDYTVTVPDKQMVKLTSSDISYWIAASTD